MKVWFKHDGRVLVSDAVNQSVLPIVDKNGGHHIVRWGIESQDDQRFPRGHWVSTPLINGKYATWVPIPALKYEERLRHTGTLVVELNEPLAGALYRIPGTGARIYLVDSRAIGKTVVVPYLFSELQERIQSGRPL